MKRILIFCFCLLLQFCYAQHNEISHIVEDYKSISGFPNYDIFNKANGSRNNLPNEIKDYSILKLDRQKLQKLMYTSEKAVTLTIPVNDRSVMELELVETTLEGLIIKTSDSDKPVKYNHGRHFKGIVKGQSNSIVALSFFENDVMGFISEERGLGNYVVGKMEDKSEDFIIYRDNELMKKLEMNCGTLDTNLPYTKEELEHNHNDRALTDCVKMYFEVDNNIFVQKGGSTQTINYVTGLYNQVSALYLAESIKTTLSEIFVWTTTSPYTGSTSSAMLNQFTAYRNGFNGNIAMLLSYGASGGIAYVNTLCNSNSDYRMGFSSIASSYSTVPTYSWSVEVVTHEFGHLLGSQHTHACAWNGNNTAIDGCYATEGGCPNPGLPSNGGTVMSYCHLTSTGINFSNGFGTQPGNVIRSKVTAATCLAACPGSNPPTCTDGIQNGQETGIDCGGPSCPPCSTGCNTNSGTLTLILDNYPGETTWNIKNAAGTTLYSGGPYNVPNSTVSVAVCLPNSCYSFNIFDSYGDGICCSYGQGSFNLVVSGNNVASGGQFTSSKTVSFCLGTSAPTCTDGIQNGQETGVDCGGPTCPACPTAPTCTDGIQNGQETGVDCGGPTCPACPTAPTCTDGIQNGQETGVDCGGPSCPVCPTAPTCTDGIQNGQETGVDCGGSTCPACPSGPETTLGAYYFETGWDNWTDGGEDAERYTGSRSFEGVWSIALRDNSGVLSSMTSPAYPTATSYLSMKVEFNFFAFSMETGEDFFLQFSNNNGASWTTIGTWISGTNYNNNTFYAATVSINNSTYGFTNTSKFRFVCDASTNSDLIYIDAVKVKGLTTASIEGGELLMLNSLQHNNPAIAVYPNPAQSTINIDLPIVENTSKYEVMLYDITGKLILSTFTQNSLKLDVSKYNTGMYFIRIGNEDEIIHSQKIIIVD
jgi:hypothetical protein